MNEIKIVAPDNHFDCVLVSAVRYCIGRRTYMPEMVTDWIRGHCKDAISDLTIGVMIHDIDTAPSLGDDCDVQTWMGFRAWLAKVKDERSKGGRK